MVAVPVVPLLQVLFITPIPSQSLTSISLYPFKCSAWSKDQRLDDEGENLWNDRADGFRVEIKKGKSENPIIVRSVRLIVLVFIMCD